MSPIGGAGAHAAELHRAFDQAFANTPKVSEDRTENLLLVRVGGDRYALRLSEMAGLARGRAVVALPSRRPELLGVCGIRGSAVCVYSLAALLGYTGATSKPAPWLILCGDKEPVGLAFDAFEGLLRTRSLQVRDGPADTGDRLLRGVVQEEGTAPRPVLDLRAIEATVRRTTASTASRSPPGRDS